MEEENKKEVEVKELTIMEKLYQEFPEEKIKNRIIKDGDKEKVLSYIPGADVIRRLNDCFGIIWDFKVVDKIIDVDIGQVAVLGELTVYQEVCGSLVKIKKQQWGSSQISCFHNGQVVSLGDDIKIATTDSLKKCASLFGIATYLYDDDKKDISSNTPIPITNETKGKLDGYRGKTESENKTITKSQVNSILKLCKDNNITKEKLLEVLQVKEMSEISYSVAASFIVDWKKFFPDEEKFTLKPSE